MNITGLSPQQFMVLSTLVDGRKKRAVEMREQLSWPKHRAPNYCRVAWSLCRRRLIKQETVIRERNSPSRPRRRDLICDLIREMPEESKPQQIKAKFEERYAVEIREGRFDPPSAKQIVDIRCDIKRRPHVLPSHLEKATLYSITERGRQSWQETLDFFLFYAFELPQNDQGSREPRIICTDPPASSERTGWRYLTVPEERRMLTHVDPEFRVLCRAFRFINATVSEIVRLQIEDVDFEENVLRVGGRTHPIIGTLRKLLEQAIGDRTEGLVFVPSRADAWTLCNVRSRFTYHSRKAGLPINVKLAGRLPHWRNQNSHRPGKKDKSGKGSARKPVRSGPALRRRAT